MLSETPMSKESQNCWFERTPEGGLVRPSGAIAMLDQVNHAFSYPFSAWLLLRKYPPSLY